MEVKAREEKLEGGFEQEFKGARRAPEFLDGEGGDPHGGEVFL